jgi:hypothetical protein
MSAPEGDPGKMAYLRNPNYQCTPTVDLRDVQVMPGTCERCVFGTGIHADDCVVMVRSVGVADAGLMEAD